MEAISLRRVYDYEASRGEMVSAEHSLRVALARTGKRNFAKSVFFAWPNLEKASLKLAALITHHYPNRSGDGFLLDEALAAACNLYDETIETSTYSRRMALYLEAMLQGTANQLLAWDTHGIIASGETMAWPVGAIPILEWVKKKNLERIVFTRRADGPSQDECEAGRIALSSALLTFNDLVQVTRLNAKG